MFRLLAILSLCTYIGASTELCQLLKLPGLFSHYVEHTETDPDETFLCFLTDHYLNGEHHSEGEEHEHGIPFGCHHDCVAHALQLVAPVPYYAVVYSIQSPVSEPPVLDDASYSFLLSKDVWQPPKA